MGKLTKRQAAEAIEKFGDELRALDKAFGHGFDNETCDRVNAVEGQDHLERIARAFQQLGDQMCRECDEAEDAAPVRANQRPSQRYDPNPSQPTAFARRLNTWAKSPK